MFLWIFSSRSINYNSCLFIATFVYVDWGNGTTNEFRWTEEMGMGGRFLFPETFARDQASENGLEANNGKLKSFISPKGQFACAVVWRQSVYSTLLSNRYCLWLPDAGTRFDCNFRSTRTTSRATRASYRIHLPTTGDDFSDAVELARSILWALWDMIIWRLLGRNCVHIVVAVNVHLISERIKRDVKSFVPIYSRCKLLAILPLRLSMI